MRYHISLVIPAMLGLTVPALAQSPQEATGTQETVVATDPDQKIKCKRIEVTGSLVRKERVCKTVAEWRALQESGNQNARDIVDHGRGRPSGGS